MRIRIIDVSLVLEDVETVEDLFLVKRDLNTMDAGFQELGLDTPEWISEKQLAVGAEITSRVRAELQRQLKTSRARRSNLATADEKRLLLDSKIADLEKKLG